MKATMMIPDELYRSVKAKSAMLGLTVREVTVDLFRRWVAEDEVREARDNPATDWVEDWLRHRIPAGKPGPTAREILEQGRGRLEAKGSRGVEAEGVASRAKKKAVAKPRSRNARRADR
jgi:hypothetical protein